MQKVTALEVVVGKFESGIYVTEFGGNFDVKIRTQQVAH